jgi:hypothetical protein
MRLVYAALAVGVLGVSCGSGGSSDAAQPTAPPGGVLMRFGGQAVAAEVAATNEDRAAGLMHRERLGSNSGMLFLFPRPTSSGFWMKDTLIPLSIAFLEQPTGSIFEVVAVLDMEPCRSDPCTLYNPGVSYDAALEVNKGWFDQAGIRRGDTATVEGSLPTPQ